MTSINSIQSNLCSYRASESTADRANASPTKAFCINKCLSLPSFAATQSAFAVRTTLNKDEEQKYVQLVNSSDKNTRKQLDALLKNGILLNANSNDNSTVLDNLHKMTTNQRADGLNSQLVLKETVNTIYNPFVITQNFGDIPKNYKQKVINQEMQTVATSNLIPPNEAAAATNVYHSTDCVAASIEFNLAKKMPAEFARFAEQLTSPKLSVEKTIQMKNLNDNPNDAKWLLDEFMIPYVMDTPDTARLVFAPDKNALLRAQIQNDDKDWYERSLVDVLMQSTFMNVGSQQSYDSLIDIRGGKFNQDKKGLNEFEKTFTESVVEDKNKISMIYQTVDENGKVVGYETDFNTMKKQLLDSLAMGENVIIGYTQTDRTNKIEGGHEITIIGAKQDKNGKIIFICNDTDDDKSAPIEYSEDYIIPKIHHAGLPQVIAEQYPAMLEKQSA